MSERVLAACDACGKRYRVPDPTKAYGCKACEEGQVRALEAGAPTEDARRHDFDPDEDLRRAGRTVTFVQVAFWVHFAFAALGLWAFLTTGEVEWTTGAYAAIAAVLSTQTAVALVGALNARFSPFACAVALAVLWALGKGLRVAAGETFAPSSALALVDLVWGLSLFVTLLPAAGAQKAIAEHPDLYAARRDPELTLDRELRGTASMRLTSALRAREEERRRTRFRTCVALAGIYAVAGAGTWATYAASRVQEPADAIDALTEAWRLGDLDALGAAYGEERRALATERLAGVVAPHAWETWPELRMTEMTREEETLDATFDVGLEHGQVRAAWRLDDDAWLLEELSVPPPSLDALAVEFSQAWNGEDLAKVVATFQLEDPEPTTRNLREMIDAQGWADDWPAIRTLDRVTYRASESSAEQAMTLETDQALAVKWRLEGGRWRVHSIRPPAR